MCRASGRSVFTGPIRENIFTSGQTVKNTKNSNFLSFNGCVPNLETRTMTTKVTGFSALVKRTSSLFEGRPHSRVLQFLWTVVLFLVLLAGFGEWFYIPAGSLPIIRRVISCILSALEQSRVLDLTVAEDHPDSILEPNVLSDEFAQLFVATYLWFSKAILSNSMMSCSVHPMSDKQVQKVAEQSRKNGWMLSMFLFDSLCQACLWSCNTFVVVQKVHVWLRACYTSW